MLCAGSMVASPAVRVRPLCGPQRVRESAESVVRGGEEEVKTELALRDLKGNEHEADQERTPPGPGDWETPAVRLGGLTID